MRKKQRQIYHAYRGKGRWKKAVLLATAVLLLLALLFVLGTRVLFRRELAIAALHVPWTW